jgi:hypothetical protein
MGAVKEYDAKLDSRKRLTIREAEHDHYHVQEFEDGTIVLEPRVLVSPNALTAETMGFGYLFPTGDLALSRPHRVVYKCLLAPLGTSRGSPNALESEISDH